MILLLGCLYPPLMIYARGLGRELSCYKLTNYLIADHAFAIALQTSKMDRFIEKLLEDIGLKRAAGFAGHDEDRLVDVDILFDGPDLRRISRIQHMHLRTPRLVPVGLGENLDAQA